MSDALVELKDVHFEYRPRQPVLAGAAFALWPGQRVALRGRNGSGKSTLLHILVGLRRPAAGAVIAFGRPCRTEADFRLARKRIGLLFEDPDDQLFCATVEEDVAFGPFNLGWPRGRVAEAVGRTLDALGLSGFETRITTDLSRGEKRLVSLATILAMEPDVLLLDEPTAGLDEENAARVIDLLRRHPAAMVLVSPDESVRCALANRTVDLHDGTLSEAPSSPV
jgi:cobalt/nickel transport system ATP-binding protein